jgi:hypothetical protein
MVFLINRDALFSRGNMFPITFFAVYLTPSRLNKILSTILQDVCHPGQQEEDTNFPQQHG